MVQTDVPQSQELQLVSISVQSSSDSQNLSSSLTGIDVSFSNVVAVVVGFWVVGAVLVRVVVGRGLSLSEMHPDTINSRSMQKIKFGLESMIVYT